MGSDIQKSKQNLEKREYHTESFGIFFEVGTLLYSGSSDFQKIEVFENDTFGKVLLLDGLVQTTEKDEFFYHEMLVHPACVTHPSLNNVLIIGGGDGGTLKEVLRYPVKGVCHVEIDRDVISVAKKYFPWLSEAQGDERYELFVEDGAEFLRNTDKKFDVVLIDSSEPTGPSAVLHERPFYESIKRCLNPGGIIVPQLGSPLYHLDFIKGCASFFGDLFVEAKLFVGPVPTYPGGSWCYGFLSDGTDPLQIKRSPPPGLKYYNQDIHRAAFALPAFMTDALVSS